VHRTRVKVILVRDVFHCVSFFPFVLVIFRASLQIRLLRPKSVFIFTPYIHVYKLNYTFTYNFTHLCVCMRVGKPKFKKLSMTERYTKRRHKLIFPILSLTRSNTTIFYHIYNVKFQFYIVWLCKTSYSTDFGNKMCMLWFFEKTRWIMTVDNYAYSNAKNRLIFFFFFNFSWNVDIRYHIASMTTRCAARLVSVFVFRPLGITISENSAVAHD
jgi:hypothetical protein